MRHFQSFFFPCSDSRHMDSKCPRSISLGSSMQEAQVGLVKAVHQQPTWVHNDAHGQLLYGSHIGRLSGSSKGSPEKYMGSPHGSTLMPAATLYIGSHIGNQVGTHEAAYVGPVMVELGLARWVPCQVIQQNWNFSSDSHQNSRNFIKGKISVF